jgi:type VI protein secretion system component VasF
MRSARVGRLVSVDKLSKRCWHYYQIREDGSMNLLELCEPLFQYVCRLNRAGRKGGHFEYSVVRAEIKALFEDLETRSRTDFLLKQKYEKDRLPLLFFADSMIAESKLPFAGKWGRNRLAYDENELAGDEKFFNELDATMLDNAEDVSERLAVFYVCLGLGFTGFYHGQPEYLRKKMLELAPRVRHYMELDPLARICPENYQNVDARDLSQPPGRNLVYILIIFLIACISAIACNAVLFQDASSSISGAVKEILKQETALANHT